MPTQNEQLIDKLVECYNSHNARGFADCFAENVKTYEHPNILSQNSREEIFETYEKVFAMRPNNRTTVVHRIIIGNRIIDHEKVNREINDEPFDAIAIYEIENNLIQRFDLVRKTETILIK
jgi:hypothetical protein